MTPEAANTYDLVPYESHPFPQTHPNRLAVVGTLFGMRPTPVDRCRVLELGCASGGNLIPMAVQFPESRFIGVDLSQRQTNEGRETIQRLGLTNIEIRHASILDVDESYGKFDYVICHGVFSWVPTEVQEAIFRIAATLMNPQGIAYVSYNTYPGWHMRGMIREMMRYHAANFSTPKIRTRQARALLDFLAGSVPQDGGPFAALLKQEVEVLRRHADHYLFHEHLEEVNQPLFFHQFVERAGAHNLRYLGESNVRTMIVGNMPEDVQKALRVMATDQVQIEQYMDFLRNRTFRETLLCHSAGKSRLAAAGKTLSELSIASNATPAEEPVHLNPGVNATYRTVANFSVTTSIPIMKAIYETLRSEYPCAMPFGSLVSQACSRLGTDTLDKNSDEIAKIAARLLHTFLHSDMIELQLQPFKFTANVAERPVACPLARHLAANGIMTTNRLHQSILLNPTQRAIVPLLDGNRTRSDVLHHLAQCKYGSQSSEMMPHTANGLDGTTAQAGVSAAIARCAKSAILIE